MKMLFNPVDCVVTDALAGMAAARPSLSVDLKHAVIPDEVFTSPAPSPIFEAATPELTRLWDAPVDTPGLRWGR